MTKLDLTGRTALVTGGAQGLGEGMAQALADAGAKVAIADIQDDLGGKVAETLGDGHGFVHLEPPPTMPAPSNAGSSTSENITVSTSATAPKTMPSKAVTSLYVDLIVPAPRTELVTSVRR